MVLNEQQEFIVRDCINRIKAGQQVYEYSGEAGTGKSVVMYEIARRLGYYMNCSLENFLSMAYTGQASIVMRTKGFYNARTLHSGLYNIENNIKRENGVEVYNTYYNAPELGMEFVPKPKLDNIKAIFIDEGRMVPYSMKKVIESYGLPVIVGGDDGQLPPVKDKPAYIIDGSNIPHLDMLMRQAESDPIVYIARRARRGLPIHNGLYSNNNTAVLVIEKRDLSDEMIKNSNIVLCGRNKTRDQINRTVREEILGINNTLPVFGDRMICRKNNARKEIDGINLANGLIGTVISSPDVTNFDGKTWTMDFLPDLLHNPFRSLVCDYEYFSTPNESRHYNKYARGERFEYAYAITTHLSQGAEVDKGIYIEEYMHPDIQNCLNYTGITRFKKYLIYVKEDRKNFYFIH